MLAQIQTLSANFKTTDHLLALSVSDLNADTASRPSRVTEGPSILWQIEHMMATRQRMLHLINPSLPATCPAKDSPVDLNHLMTRWTTLANDLQHELEHCTLAALTAEARGGPHGEGTAFDLINFLSWHEAYHFGGIGSTRKVLGLPEVADLARDHHKAQTAKQAPEGVALVS